MITSGVRYKNLDRFGDQIAYGVFTKQLPFQKEENSKKVLGFVGEQGRGTADLHPVSFIEQLHSAAGVVITEETPRENLRGDFLITKLAQTPLLIRIADCASIMLFDPTENTVANIHAGWRGLTKHIVRETIKQMCEQLGSKPKNIVAAISPMLGVCCSTFSNPYQELPPYFHRYINEENHVNLWAVVQDSLIESGVSKKNIENPRICTYCNPETYHSYRREGLGGGRFATIIMLK